MVNFEEMSSFNTTAVATIVNFYVNDKMLALLSFCASQPPDNTLLLVPTVLYNQWKLLINKHYASTLDAHFYNSVDNVPTASCHTAKTFTLKPQVILATIENFNLFLVRKKFGPIYRIIVDEVWSVKKFHFNYKCFKNRMRYIYLISVDFDNKTYVHSNRNLRSIAKQICRTFIREMPFNYGDYSCLFRYPFLSDEEKIVRQTAQSTFVFGYKHCQKTQLSSSIVQSNSAAIFDLVKNVSKSAINHVFKGISNNVCLVCLDETCSNFVIMSCCRSKICVMCVTRLNLCPVCRAEICPALYTYFSFIEPCPTVLVSHIFELNRCCKILILTNNFDINNSSKNYQFLGHASITENTESVKALELLQNFQLSCQYINSLSLLIVSNYELISGYNLNFVTDLILGNCDIVAFHRILSSTAASRYRKLLPLNVYPLNK